MQTEPKTDIPSLLTTGKTRSDAPDLKELTANHSRLRGVIQRYETDRRSIERKYPLTATPSHFERLKRLDSDWLGLLAQLDYDSLETDDRIDYLLVKSHLEHHLRQIELDAKRQEEIAPLLPFALNLYQFEETRQRMEPVNPEKAAAVLTETALQAAELRQKIETQLAEKGKTEPYKATIANRAAENLKRIQSALDHWFSFYNGYDPLFTWWVEQPHKELNQALQQYAAFLREKIVGVKPDDKNAIVGDPIGREALLVELQYERIPYTPEELIAIAKREMSWCETEMKRASHDLGYGADWHRALEHVKTLHVEPGRQPQMIHELAIEAISFLDEHDLVTIPPLARETWRMEMMSPERQLVNPFFLGGEMIQVSFPTAAMTQEQKMMSMRGNNIHFARATVQHELIPGHHLQGFMADRYKSYRQIFSTPFYIEGWALHWEMLLWDMNFAKSPENRIGMLFWRLHRCARIIFSLSFHLEQMTVPECIDMLVNQVGHERANAEGEVRRSFKGEYVPLYQAAYLLGGLQMRALHHELVGSGKMTDRAFHDAVLKENSIPIEFVRAALTGQKLPLNFTTQWKFYGSIEE